MIRASNTLSLKDLTVQKVILVPFEKIIHC